MPSYLRALWRFVLAFLRASEWRVAAFRLRLGRQVGPVLALALLLAVGLVTLRAAGGLGHAATSTPPVVSRQALVGDDTTPLPTVTSGATVTVTATASATATQAPQATATTAPQATATNTAPTATPSPTDTPAPTATAAPPSWHTIGTYSGSAAQDLYTFGSQYENDQVQILWTCTVTQSLPSWTIGFTAPKNTGYMTCQAGNTSGVFGADWVIAPYDVQMTDSAGGSWTATLQVYY